MDENERTKQIIGAAIQVHKALGPGLLESIYEECLAYELIAQNIPFERQVPFPVKYRDKIIDTGLRADLWVNKQVVVELKAVETLKPVHDAQILTYLKISGCRLCLLINFNEVRLKSGIKRCISGY